MKYLTLSIACAAGLLAVWSSATLAQTTDTASTAVLTAEEAIAIALKAQPGTIGEAELDAFDGRPAYDIEVIDEAGQEIEFKIDATSGEILNTWTDDDPSDDPVSGAGEEDKS
ncbi:MAG: PepSY domain-containing protein [Pseudomonadota bacterium]